MGGGVPQSIDVVQAAVAQEGLPIWHCSSSLQKLG